MSNQNLNMERLIVFKNSNLIKLAKDYAGRLYRIVKSDISIHKGEDDYFCFIQRKRGLFWRNIEVISYEGYLDKINGQESVTRL